jgi:RNA polymerase sigma-70 factor (ECF subfamily)
MSGTTTEILRGWLLKLADNDVEAKQALLLHTQSRLVCIARSKLGRLNGLEQPEDVVQEAYLRLLEGWDSVVRRKDGQIVDVKDYLANAANLVRQSLIKLIRKHFGRNYQRPPPLPLDLPVNDAKEIERFDPGCETYVPDVIALFTDFHEAVESLPQRQREVVDLHYYQGLTHKETALALAVSEGTVRNDWVEAQLTLQQRFGKNPLEWRLLRF